MEHQLVILELENESYGVNIAAVESIIKMQSITKIPHAPSFVEGIINLRGKILPIIDLRKRFDLESKNVSNDGRIVVVSIDKSEVGMIVDGVSEVMTVTDQEIEPPPQMVTSIKSEFISGIAKSDDRLVILLDLNVLLSLDEKKEINAFSTSI